MEFSGENEILRGAFRLVSHVTVHFVLYLGNFGSLFGQCTHIGMGYYTKIYCIMKNFLSIFRASVY